MIHNNTIENNSKGFHFYSNVQGNIIYHNNIINNTEQANDTGANTWNNTEHEGNYWSDYNGTDNGSGGRIAGDGIGDTDIPHLGLDNYPFTQKWGWAKLGRPILQDPGTWDSDGSYSLSWNSISKRVAYT